MLFTGFDPEELRKIISASQRQRLAVHKATSGDPTYVKVIRDDDGQHYIRNAGAADTKAKARRPYVTPTKTSSSSRIFQCSICCFPLLVEEIIAGRGMA